MKRPIATLVVFLLLQSCIPLRVAPKIDSYRVVKGKKFKRSLPKRQMFIFEDYKDANAFYDYINVKFNLHHNDVYDNVPFTLNVTQFFFAFYEVEIPDKTINLIPIMIDGLLQNTTVIDPMFEELHTTRKGNCI